MRKHLLVSTATICLMLASGFAYAQAPEKRDEPKRMERSEPGKGAAAHSAEERTTEHAKGEAAREEKAPGGREASDEKNRPETSAEHKGAAANDERDRARSETSKQNEQEAGHNEREAAGAKENREGAKESKESKQGVSEQGAKAENNKAENKAENNKTEENKAENEKARGNKAEGNTANNAEKAAREKSTAESEKSKAGTEATQNERNQNEHGERSQNAAEQRPGGKESHGAATANENTRTSPTNNAQNPQGTQPNQNQAAQSRTNEKQANETEPNRQARISVDKQVRISETLNRVHIAPPEHDLNVSVRVGEEIPPRVHVYHLPPEIATIEPEYRDYDYFATDDDIVIVEPHTHQIVSEIPRDVSRIRAEAGAQGAGGVAQVSGGVTSVANAGGGAPPCKIMRRDSSGRLSEVTPSTVGSTASPDSLSTSVQVPGSGSTPPIALGAPAGQIVVATQGHGDCTVTIEPQTP